MTVQGTGHSKTTPPGSASSGTASAEKGGSGTAPPGPAPPGATPTAARESRASGTARLPSARDGRVLPYAFIALGGLAGSLFSGQPALAVLAIPFILALALGLRRTGRTEVTARIVLDADQLLEGDFVSGRLEVEWDAGLEAEILLHRLQGVAAVSDEALAWTPPPAARAFEVPIELRAAMWGRHTVCEVWVRLEAPLGLLSWTGKVVAGPTLRVLPRGERLKRLLDPAESRAVAGMHRSKRIGGDGEFAELRPYAPGDRLRDLNWAATARHGRPFVNRHHPEMSGDVVLAIDAFGDGSTGSAEALAQAARAAWALASLHLGANDRVGLAGLGGRVRWLPPAGGRLARYRLLETLLRIGGETARGMPLRSEDLRAVPPSALVIAITPLHDPLTLRLLASLRARGRTVAVIRIDAGEWVGEPGSTAEALAARLWRIEIDRSRRELERLGIPVVTAPAGGRIEPVVLALRRARRAPSVRRGR